MKVRSILVPLLMACLLFSGCGHNRPAQTADGSGSDIHTGFVQSESVDADVYLDGTMSMAGYVNYAMARFTERQSRESREVSRKRGRMRRSISLNSAMRLLR